CIFPGCHKKRFVDAHHVQHWSAGGETSLDNLVLLCTKHHTLVHEGGFTIDRDFQNRWFFRRPDGRALPNCGYHDRDMIDDDIGDFSALFNNPSAEGLLSGLEKPSAQSPPG
ncbi:MAG: HNH endonuclease signature motif containing protein, partial [Acidiferrobacterales bacterium]|nr:HNH endonuclease signature motif containing protein [Acidiferrobacterales bacterium]